MSFTGGSANTGRGMSDARVCLQDSFWEDQLASPQRPILLKSETDGPFDPYADQPRFQSHAPLLLVRFCFRHLVSVVDVWFRAEAEALAPDGIYRYF